MSSPASYICHIMDFAHIRKEMALVKPRCIFVPKTIGVAKATQMRHNVKID